MKYVFILLAAVLFILPVSSQDIRTVETRVADLLAQMPAKDPTATAGYMNDMINLGRPGLDLICSRVVPAGSGDDTAPRFAIESLSRHLSAAEMQKGRMLWETTVLEWIDKSSDTEVKIFFMSQLHYVGTDNSLTQLGQYLADADLAEPAVAAIVAIGSEASVDMLLASLKGNGNRAKAATLNGLALLQSGQITGDLMTLASDSDSGIRAAAYRALAATGSAEAAPVLLKAASSASYKWEKSGAVASLLSLADNMGAQGNLKGMDKILNQIMLQASKAGSTQYVAGVLDIRARYYGSGVQKDLLKAMKSGDTGLRGAALRIAASLEGEEITEAWVNALKSFSGEPRAEIAAMLGERGDKAAAPVLAAMLSDKDVQVRIAAAEALAAVSGKEAIGSLIEYMMKQEDGADQNAAASALVTLLDAQTIGMVADKTGEAGVVAKGTMIGILAWSNNDGYFDTVAAFTGSEDEGVRASALMALKSLASEKDQEKILALYEEGLSRYEINELQLALAAAVLQNNDKEERVGKLIESMKDEKLKPFIIPVLGRVGGMRAAKVVLDEFENGDSGMRDICFESLLYWSDHYALNSLYEICASGNKRFGNASFDAFIRQVTRSAIPDEQKLLYLKKILPYALTVEQKEILLESAGSIRTYLSLFLVGQFFEEPDLAPTAARSAMRIAMPAGGETTGMTGAMVREILGKSITHLTGNESEYDKERMRKYLASMPADEGFVSMFNGRDLTGWQGLVGNPVTRAKMTPAELAARQKEADQKMLQNWSVRDDMIWFSGSGANLCSVKKYGDFEMLVDWRITRDGESGIYLRGSPQIQIWDTSRTDVGAQVGSGGLYNNQVHPSKPMVVADNQIGEWNTFRIIMTGEKVSVWLNGILVVDDVVMENYWDRSIPIFASEAIELQAHGTDLAFRDIYVREISEREYNLTPVEKAEGFVSLFNGRNLDGWIGDKVSYVAEDGMIVIKPAKGSGGNLFTDREYSDFVFRFEFQLTPGANNGLGIRAPLVGDAAYVGMELQILDNTAAIYANLEPYQYHGSVYGVIAAKRGHLKPVGEWNYQEVVVQGTRVKVTLNGVVIVDGDIAEASKNGTIDGHDHPGLKRLKGYIGFLGHGSLVKFRNIRVKEL